VDINNNWGKEKETVKNQAIKIEDLVSKQEKDKKAMQDLEASNKQKNEEAAILNQDKESLQSKVQ
jgi:hypothetical protein